MGLWWARERPELRVIPGSLPSESAGGAQERSDFGRPAAPGLPGAAAACRGVSKDRRTNRLSTETGAGCSISANDPPGDRPNPTIPREVRNANSDVSVGLS